MTELEEIISLLKEILLELQIQNEQHVTDLQLQNARAKKRTDGQPT